MAVVRRNFYICGMGVRKRMKTTSWQDTGMTEILVYVLLWSLVFLFPVMNEAVNGDSFSWGGIFRWWTGTLPFLLIFLIHCCFLVPRFLFRRRIIPYVLTSLLLVLMLGSYKYITFDGPKRHSLQERVLESDDPHESGHNHGGAHHHEHTSLRPPHPHTSVPLPVIMDTVLALLMLGFNMAVILYFRYRREQARIKELENTRMQDELKYLKAQINPHFFMNMLNNIHGMVDSDPAKAQDMILELSKLMRYGLYEGRNQFVSFEKEASFIRSYVLMMGHRYPEDKVKISFEIWGDDASDVTLPPLLYISFIENAFKHGISYRKTSAVEVALGYRDGKIYFECRNTKPENCPEPAKEGGVGLSNVRRRLELLYGHDYTLVIEDTMSRYVVKLIIPALK